MGIMAVLGMPMNITSTFGRAAAWLPLSAFHLPELP